MGDNNTFTEEDMQNDGLFKTELQDTVKQVASREHSELYQYFNTVCEGQAPPEVVLAAACVRALNDDEFAERVSRVEPEIVSVKKSQHRTDDLEYVLELQEEFGVGDNGGGIEEALTKQIEEEIAGTTQDPLERVTGMIDGQAMESESNERIDRLEDKLDRVLEGGSASEAQVEDGGPTPEEREEQVEELLDEEVIVEDSTEGEIEDQPEPGETIDDTIDVVEHETGEDIEVEDDDDTPEEDTQEDTQDMDDGTEEDTEELEIDDNDMDDIEEELQEEEDTAFDEEELDKMAEEMDDIGELEEDGE